MLVLKIQTLNATPDMNGIYRVRCISYVAHDKTLFNMFMAKPLDSEEVKIIDMVVATSSGEMIGYENYARHKNGMWRNSAGEARVNLQDLLPEKLKTAKRVQMSVEKMFEVKI